MYVTQEVARKQVPKDPLLSKVPCPNLVLGNAIFSNNNNISFICTTLCSYSIAKAFSDTEDREDREKREEGR